MTKAYNATRHDQTSVLHVWKRFGVEFVPTPGRMNSIPPQASVEYIDDAARDVVLRAQYAGADAILVGGLTGLSIVIALRAIHSGLRIIEPIVRNRNGGVPDIVGVRDLTDTIVARMENERERRAER